MKPLERIEAAPPEFLTWCAVVSKITGIRDRAKLRELYEQEFVRSEYWSNALYLVIKSEIDGGTHLTIGPSCALLACEPTNNGHDWRRFQQIKNQLCGPEREAIELYPAESRLIDTADRFHLWVLPEGKQFPIGYFVGRHVAGPEMGFQQRSFENDNRNV